MDLGANEDNQQSLVRGRRGAAAPEAENISGVDAEAGIETPDNLLPRTRINITPVEIDLGPGPAYDYMRDGCAKTA